MKLALSRRKKVLVIVAAALIIATLTFIIWAETPLGPMPEALQALQSDSVVQVVADRWLVFQPASGMKKSAFIFYPGGRVDERSYAPLAHAVAEQGYLAVIVPMPLNLAVFGVDKASEVIAAYPQVSAWVIGGHSLGGSMAAQYALKNPASIDGLLLCAAFPASSDDLSNANLSVVSIFGSRDGLVSSVEINSSAKLLPNTTVWMEIVGGNHAQFGYYGIQPGDNEATITRELQQSMVVEAVTTLLSQVADP